MTRKFRKPDYEATLKAPIILEDALSANHLARFVVDIIAQLDLNKIYAGYAEQGGKQLRLTINGLCRRLADKSGLVRPRMCNCPTQANVRSNP